LRAGRGTPAAPARSGPSVLLLLSDPPRVPPYLSLDRRRLDAGGAIARQGLAIDLHSRPAALSAVSLSTPGRCDDAGHRPLGHGQGAGGACDRFLALPAFRPRNAQLRRASRRVVLPPQSLRALSH